MAQQLAGATAREARARHALERENARVERENARLVRENARLAAEVEDAAATLARRVAEPPVAARRTRWLTYGALLVAAGVGALLLVLGPLAASGVAGLPRRLPSSVPGAPPVTPDLPAAPAAESLDRAWGRDWPLAIRLLEERAARQPGDPVVRDKLYAAYVEHAKALWRDGDHPSARGRLGQARDYDPDRGVAELVREALEQGTPTP